MINSTLRQSFKFSTHKGSLVINQTFLLVLALIMLVILVGFTIFLGVHSEDMLKRLGSLVPKVD